MAATEQPSGRHGSIAGFAQMRALMDHHNYRAFIIGDFASLIGNWVQRVAIGWLTWEMTHSTTWLGIMAFADLFPAVIAAPIGGAIADRGDPRLISLKTQSLQMLQATLLFLLYVGGLLTIWLLVLLTVARGALAAINQPARMSLVPTLLPREHLPSGLALNSLAFNLSRFIGPIIGGFAIATGGVGLAVLINALSYIAMIYALWIIDVAPPQRSSRSRSARDTLDQIVAGFIYVKGQHHIALLLLMLVMVAFLGKPVGELLPGFTARVFNRDATGLALMTSAMGLGAIVGGYSLIGGKVWRSLTQALFANMIILATALTLFATTHSFYFALLMLAAIGFALTVNGVCTQSLLQATVDDSYRGRVMSLYSVIFRGIPALGALIIGIVSDRMGLALPVIAAGLLMGIAWLVLINQKQDLERHFDPSNRP